MSWRSINNPQLISFIALPSSPCSPSLRQGSCWLEHLQHVLHSGYVSLTLGQSALQKDREVEQGSLVGRFRGATLHQPLFFFFVCFFSSCFCATRRRPLNATLVNASGPQLAPLLHPLFSWEIEIARIKGRQDHLLARHFSFLSLLRTPSRETKQTQRVSTPNHTPLSFSVEDAGLVSPRISLPVSVHPAVRCKMHTHSDLYSLIVSSLHRPRKPSYKSLLQPKYPKEYGRG